MKAIVFAAVALAGITHAGTTYPFPYFADYPFGNRAMPNSTTASNKAQTEYVAWKATYYEECSDGQKARIKWADPKASGSCNSSGNCTVSEGIGYGMLITVYMDNATNNTKPMFDKLWKYYNAFLDNKGLMNWQVNGCSGTISTGAATDAEVDVALALCMAAKQWPGGSYESDAKTLLGKIWSAEVDGSKLLKPGSQFGSPYNPSYFAVGALRVFATVDPSHDWSGVADACMALIKKNQNSTTGLNTDWCDGNGGSQNYNGSGTGKFGYDAVRTPWRVALGYLWFGKSAEADMLTKMDTWIKSKTSNWSQVYAEWSADGSSSANYNNALYLGAFAVTAMVNKADSSWLRQGSQIVYAKASDGYFNDSWQVMYNLTLLGNMQNFLGTVKTSTIGVSGHAVRGAASWFVTTTSQEITLKGEGSVRAELRDAHGRLLQATTATGNVEFARPATPGFYFARIIGSTSQATVPVLVD